MLIFWHFVDMTANLPSLEVWNEFRSVVFILTRLPFLRCPHKFVLIWVTFDIFCLREPITYNIAKSKIVIIWRFLVQNWFLRFFIKTACTTGPKRLILFNLLKTINLSVGHSHPALFIRNLIILENVFEGIFAFGAIFRTQLGCYGWQAALTGRPSQCK